MTKFRSWRRALCLCVLLAAGCAEVAKPPPPEVRRPPEPPPPTVEEKPLSPEAKRLLTKHNLKQHVVRPLNIRSHCSSKDEVGTAIQLDLQVVDSVVQVFESKVAMKKYGTCRFSLSEFQQIETRPQALLRHRQKAKCTVRLWEEGDKVAIAFNSCPAACDGDAFSYLWPIMVEAQSGRCF